MQISPKVKKKKLMRDGLGSTVLYHSINCTPTTSHTQSYCGKDIAVWYRRVFVGSIGSDCNPIRTVIFSCLTKTDIAIGLAMFCKQRSFRTPRTESY